MLIRARLFNCIVAALAVAGSASGQEIAESSGLLRNWLQSQRVSWADITEARFVETANRSIDGPTGLRVIETVLDVSVDLVSDAVDWTTRSAVVDGEAVPEASLERFGERWRRDAVSRTRSLLTRGQLGMRLLSQLTPAGPVKSEQLEGAEVRRLDLEPRSADSVIERVTLWFSEEGDRLLRSRTILHPGGEETSLVAETNFTRLNDLDVPVSREVQGTVRMKRRMRRFTTLLAVSSVLSDYRFVR